MKVLVKTKLIPDGNKQYCELRDYELGKELKVIHCTQKDYKRCYHIKEEYMILTVAKQKEGKIVNTQQSMFYPYKYYKLIRFLWKPKGKIEVMQVADKKADFEVKDGIYTAKLP